MAMLLSGCVVFDHRAKIWLYFHCLIRLDGILLVTSEEHFDTSRGG